MRLRFDYASTLSFALLSLADLLKTIHCHSIKVALRSLLLLRLNHAARIFNLSAHILLLIFVSQMLKDMQINSHPLNKTSQDTAVRWHFNYS